MRGTESTLASPERWLGRLWVLLAVLTCPCHLPLLLLLLSGTAVGAFVSDHSAIAALALLALFALFVALALRAFRRSA